MNNKAQGGAIIFLILILLVGGVWGYVGGQEAKSVGVTCDMGVGNTFCWKWHKNLVGQVQEGFENTGQAIADFFGG